MNESQILPDDPKLTAYALGELEGEERAAVEAALAHDPAMRAVVDEIRSASARVEVALATELASEKSPVVFPLRPAAIIAESDRRKLDGGPSPYPNRKLIRFPQFYYVISALAAACFAVVVAFHDNTPKTRTTIYAVNLAPQPLSVSLPRVDAESTAPDSQASTASEIAGRGPDNAFVTAAQYPLSTFGFETDTAGFGRVRHFIENHQLPPRDAVHIEELLNYFPYAYAPPATNTPFAASLEVAEAPWTRTNRLVRIALIGRELTGDQVAGKLGTIAKNVTVRVEFNPAKVARYRLIGYEHRPASNDGSSTGASSAAEIASGQTVTALYEIVPVSAEGKIVEAEPPGTTDHLRYGGGSNADRAGFRQELLDVKVGYQDPGDSIRRELEFPLIDGGGSFADASADFKFAAAVASFGMILRDSPHRGSATIGNVIAWGVAGARSANDVGGYRGEFLGLARQAQALLR